MSHASGSSAKSHIVSDETPEAVLDLIAPDEGMIVREAGREAALTHYFSCGRSALRCVRLALAAANRDAPRRILDFPCGHGRVMRMLRAAYPEAELHACDLLTAGVEFCAQQFRAVPLGSHPDPSRVTLQGPYDLIWVGSLFTHLDASKWPAFLNLFHRSLAPGGVCVITTHGRPAADMIVKGTTDYGLPDAAKLLAHYTRKGFAYRPYAGQDYGVSLSSPTWVIDCLSALPSARIVLALEKGWADHQDVFAWVRT